MGFGGLDFAFSGADIPVRHWQPIFNGNNPDLSMKHKTIRGEAPGPHLLITAGVHGDEYEPMLAVRHLLARVEPAKLCGTLTLVPLVNEPAFVRLSRTADDERDLARTCPGRDDGSITERIAAELSRLIRAADYYIDLHTGGAAFQILPLAGYVLHANPRVLDSQRKMALAFNLPVVWGTCARLEGRSLSVARDAEVPAIYVEHGGGGGCDPVRAEACAEGCLQVARALEMYDVQEGEPRVRYIVEDDRDQSGHFQVQHPAPRAGFFETQVGLGAVVRAGQPLGRIVDPLGESIEVVHAQADGVVLMLRAIPAVKAGEALVALLPIMEPGHVRIER